MKRLIAVLLCGLMLMTGCATAPVEPTPDPVAKMTPGTYTSVGTGFKGDIKVDVTVTEDAITDITVVDAHETFGIGEAAMPVMIEEMIKYQTYSVDLVSGATVTSAGFRTAVKDAYHGEGEAHGLSFSVCPGVKIPPSLKNIYKELNSEYGCYIPNNGYLE